MKKRNEILTRLVSCALVLTSSCGVFGTSFSDDAETSRSGLTNVTSMPCAVAGGTCRAAQECGVGTGSLGGSDYNCGGSRRVCCFTTCGTEVESFECCNADHTQSPRPLCKEGKLTCANGQTKVPIGSCVASQHP
jgi:hypothetical protein